jgi:hypothetical protein
VLLEQRVQMVLLAPLELMELMEPLDRRALMEQMV